MALKPPDLLSGLPTVSELLDKPPVRALVARWNRSAVAGNVRAFLDELRGNIERRGIEMPTIREMAERAARFVVTRQHEEIGAMINATGRLDGPPWIRMPLADAALERIMHYGSEFTIADQRGVGASEEMESLLCRLTGAEAVAVVHSYSAAVWLALGSLSAGRGVLVARAEMGDVENGKSLPELAAAAQAKLVEVGATNRATIADYQRAITAEVSVIFKHASDTYRVVGETADAELSELVSVARKRGLPLIDALGTAPLVAPSVASHSPRRSAQASIGSGAELVLLRGDALVGGPSCGIVVGRRKQVDRFVEHPLFASCQLDPLRTAALVATLACYESPSRGADSIPVWQCLNASIENLRNRAERLAAQLAHAPGIGSATAVETRSPLFAASGSAGQESFGVALVPSEGTANELAERLQSSSVPILSRVGEGQVVLDLRTVLPRQDQRIADSLLGPSPSSNAQCGCPSSEASPTPSCSYSTAPPLQPSPPSSSPPSSPWL
ncbi:MAG: hypothetical protein IT425_03520 [Pirellulales bacterium]|nr:hypothetical protein [Pirellulales bacterium]